MGAAMRTLKKCAGGCGRYIFVFDDLPTVFHYCMDCRRKYDQGGTLDSISKENERKPQ